MPLDKECSDDGIILVGSAAVRLTAVVVASGNLVVTGSG